MPTHEAAIVTSSCRKSRDCRRTDHCLSRQCRCPSDVPPPPPPPPALCRSLHVRSDSTPTCLHAAAPVETERRGALSCTSSPSPPPPPPPPRPAKSSAVRQQRRHLLRRRQSPDAADVAVPVPARLADSLPLRLGDLVYWISDAGAEQAEVRWLGKLPAEDGGREWMVGVQFANPIGSGTGCYRGRRLFTAQLHHASIVPISGLIRAGDMQTAKHQQKQQCLAGRQARLEVHTSDEDGSLDGPWSTACESRQRARQPQFSADLQHMSPFQQLAHEQLLCTSGALNDRSTACGQCSVSSTVDVSPLTVGTAVELQCGAQLHYAVLRWIGQLPTATTAAAANKMAGVELEAPTAMAGDGRMGGVRYFTCRPGRGVFLPLADVQRDRRFVVGYSPDGPTTTAAALPYSRTGAVECDDGVVPGRVAPPTAESAHDLSRLCGAFKGIQGDQNSCYLDATLFCMFAFSSTLDCVLFRPPAADDIAQYASVQRLLREQIVNPLRAHAFVRADRVMRLRRQLDCLSSVEGLTSEEKDAEEFVQSLLAQTLRAAPFVRFSSGQSTYLYQVIVDRDAGLCVPSVQQLFEQSVWTADIRLSEVPACLILQMPRHGRHYKLFERILPSQLLDVTDALAGGPRGCCVCGQPACLECRQCFDAPTLGLAGTCYCAPCDRVAHGHRDRRHHARRRPLHVPAAAAKTSAPRCYLQLYAVVCIETSHYVAFARAGRHWVFFDSMADRCGESDGFNIPQVSAAPDVAACIAGEFDVRQLTDADCDVRQLPEHVRRLVCDSYLCFYQSLDVAMYR